MTLHISLDENDFLTHQLFTASQSERIRKKRAKSKTVTAMIYVAMGALFMGQGNYPLGLALMVIGGLWFFLYPVWERRYYVRHYRSFIREHYTGRFGKTATLEIDEDFIAAKDEGSEGKVATSEIEEITELANHFLVRIKGGQSFILPINNLSDPAELRGLLQDIARQKQVRYSTYKNWKWQ